jgi:hypothetical protein
MFGDHIEDGVTEGMGLGIEIGMGLAVGVLDVDEHVLSSYDETDTDAGLPVSCHSLTHPPTHPIIGWLTVTHTT